MKNGFVALMVILLVMVPFGTLMANGQSSDNEDGPVTISIWGGFPEMEPFYKYATEAYTESHPNVAFDIVTHPLREFEQKLSATIPSDTASDIIEISMYSNQKFIEAGLIPELPKKVKEFFDASGRFSDFSKSNNTYNGTYYGLPIFQGRTALFWNKTMFEEAGLSGPPETMNQMAEYAKKLSQYDADGNLTRSGHSLRLSGQGSGVAEKWWFVLYPMGGTIIEEGSTPGTYHAGYNNDAGRRALQYYLDAVYNDKWDSHNIKHDADAFVLEQTAMFFRESWVIGHAAKNNPDMDYGTAPVPSDMRWGRITNPVNLYVTRSCKNPEIAWDVAMFLNNEDNLSWLLNNVGWLPVRQDIDFSDIIADKPQFEAFMFNDPDYEEFGYVGIAPFDEIMTKLAERLVSGFLDEDLSKNPAAVDEFIREAAEETDKILKKADLYGD